MSVPQRRRRPARDGGDTIFGDDGGDAIAGDNTVIERALQGGQWILDDLHSPDALDVVRRIMRERDVATTTDLAPLTNGTSGSDVIYGNNGVDVAYGQGGDDQIQGNADDDHLEGNANDDTITGNEGRDDVIGGTGRQFSNVESARTALPTAASTTRRRTTPRTTRSTAATASARVASADDDAIIGDNGTVDRAARGAPAPGNAELGRLPFNGTWTPRRAWNEPNILRVVRLLDVATTAHGAGERRHERRRHDQRRGQRRRPLRPGRQRHDHRRRRRPRALPAPADANPGDDYIEGNGGTDTHRAATSARTTSPAAARRRTACSTPTATATFDPTRSGETLSDAGDPINGDSGRRCDRRAAT